MKQCGKNSFVSQLNDLKEFTSYSLLDKKIAYDFILRESVCNVLYEFNIKQGYLYINKLNELLKVNIKTKFFSIALNCIK